MKSNQLFIVLLVIIFTATSLAAGGIQSMLTEYASVSGARIAMQAAVEQGLANEADLAELYQAEENLGREIEELLKQDSDVAQEVYRYLVAGSTRSQLQIYKRFFAVGNQKGERLFELASERVKEAQLEEFDNPFEGYATAGGACIFTDPDFASTKTFARSGDKLTVTGVSGSFYRVSVNGATGFIHESQLAAGSDEAAFLVDKGYRGQTGTVTASSLNVRKGPGTQYAIVCSLSNGTVVTILETQSGWHKVNAPNGKTGWAAGNYIKITDNNVPDNNVPDNNNNDVVPGGDIPPNLGAFKKIDNQKPTYYCTAREAEFSGGGSKQIMSTSGKVIATVCGKFYKDLCMEGSGILNDNRCVSWVANYKFQVAPAGCKGITASGKWVVTFHTLAVNKKELPFGGVYYIPKTRGMKMPNGETHDGYWFAHDTGGAFTSAHNRIDMYTDQRKWVNWMESNLVGSLKPLEVWRVDNATKEQVYAKYKQFLGK
ncbi:MAG: SH3 domain-containing protein [Candidatus Wallbacteria bacterium]|nr:SH3 domain-containing protein [Candidatus Wallbacteria bacterium]